MVMHYLNLSLQNTIDSKGELEEWKDISGYEGLYQISSCGRVKSFPRFHCTMPNGGTLYTKLKILKQKPCSFGRYLSLHLYKNKVPETVMPHILVGKTFIENSERKPQINHKDGIRFNNEKHNLEWSTSAENNLHARENNLSFRKVSKEDVLFIRNSTLNPQILAEKYNIHWSQIYRIRARGAWANIT